MNVLSNKKSTCLPLFWQLYSFIYDVANKVIPYKELLVDVIRELDLKPGQKILDAGCGTGNLELAIDKYRIKDIHIEAVDFAPRMLDLAKKKCKNMAYVNFSLADLNKKLPFKNNSFNRTVIINTLYAVTDPLFTIKEFHRILKPGGKLIISNPKPGAKGWAIPRAHILGIRRFCRKLDKFRHILNFIFQILPAGFIVALFNLIIISRGKKGKYHFWGKEKLGKILTENGFLVIRIRDTYADQNLLITAIKK